MSKRERYAWACFHGRVSLPQPYAVLTAYNPNGESIEEEANLDRQDQFLEFLEESGLVYEQMEAGARDRSHIEWSACVRCSKTDAHKIGKTLEQDAFFWVENDQLSIVYCDGSEDQFLGSMEERMV